jgi:branched-chain amino acid transport system ATP-binding protein
MDDLILETKELCKQFKGFAAVSDVSLRVKRGTIHAVIGPNGAGKTTLFNLLTKFLPPSSGTILFNKKDITKQNAGQIARQGIVRSFQISAVFPKLTVLENVRVALQRKAGLATQFWRSERSLRSLDAAAMQLLEDVGLAGFADATTVNLAYGRKRALEIATTLAMDPELMLLDEPTAGMGHEDIDTVTELIRKVAARRTIVMVEHNLGVVSTLSDTITVMQRGSVLAEGPYDVVSRNPQVLEAYVGVQEDA